MLLPTAILLLAPSVASLTTEKVSHAEVTLDLEKKVEVPVAGGSKLGIPVSEVVVTSDSLFNATCSGYSWTTTFGADTNAEYTDVEVRLDCMTEDDVPFNVIETGSGKTSASTVRRIQYEIGEPYENLRSGFFVAEVLTPVPELTLDVYKLGGESEK